MDTKPIMECNYIYKYVYILYLLIFSNMNSSINSTQPPVDAEMT